jgi:DNA polymerase III delta prime subunit
MTHQEFLASLRARGLRAWQANFVTSFLEEDSAAFHLLTAPPGTGKTYTGVAIARELAERHAKRMLVLLPAPLCEGWAGRLRDAQSELPVLVVTRKVIRAIESALPIGQSPWDAEGVYVLSHDLAKQVDLAASLSLAKWDLVIIDEAHRFAAPQRAALLNKLFSSDVTRRLLLLSATAVPGLAPWLQTSADQGEESQTPIVITSWLGKLKDWDGSTVVSAPVDLNVYSYRRAPEEVESLLRFLSSTKALEAACGARFLTEILIQRASSSPFAFEQSLQRLRYVLKSEIEGASVFASKAGLDQLEGASTSEEIDSATEGGRFEWIDKPAGLEIIDLCLSELETVNTDEKLNALKRLIGPLTEVEHDGIPTVCVFSMFADTVSYLHTAADDLGLPLFKITGASPSTERRGMAEQFMREGGLFFATDAALKGVELPQVSHVVYYDLPSGTPALEYRHSRFDRFGRNTPLIIYAFQDESGVLPLESQLLRNLTGIFETGIGGTTGT